MSGQDQDIRIARALTEGASYRWGKRPDGTFACDTGRSVYVVSDTSCTCGDYVHRCAGTDARCKHQVALGMAKLAAGKLPAAPAPKPIISEAAFERIFG